MQRNDEHGEEELIELGLVTAETKGAITGGPDSFGQPKNLMGLSDD